MKPQCIQAVQAAAGRTLTRSEIQKIDDNISSTMRRLAREDPAGWAAKSSDQRVLEAAQVGMADIQQQAALKVQRAQLQIVKTAAAEARIGDVMANFQMNRTKAFMREMEFTDHYEKGVRGSYVRMLTDLLDAVGSKQGTSATRKGLMFLFDAENPAMSIDLAREIFNNADGSTGNQLAQKGAKAWLDTIEAMRQRFNGAGGDVGKLDYGYLPQPHDQGRVRGNGEPAARDKWVQATLPLLDRSRYLLEDGSRMQDAQMADLLNNAWETIATGGLNKLEPGAGGGRGARSNAGSESRQIHFKDADAYLAYMKQYGGGSMYDGMMSHVSRMARDITLVERYGPNPELQFRLQRDKALEVDGKPSPFKIGPQGYWNVLSGKSGQADHASVAKIARDIRNVQVFGKLGGAMVSSLTDIPSYFLTAGYNNLPYFDALRNIKEVALNSETRDFLTMHGIIAESMISDMSRWSGENIGHSLSGKLANSTMKLSLLNAWTDALRRAFSLTMMKGLAKLSKTDWAALSEWDRAHLSRKGITADDWEVIRQGQLTNYRGADFLTPEAIQASGHARADEVVSKMLGLITDESEYAVLNPDLQTRAIQTWGGKQAGTLDGDLARSVMQFKSFPIAMMTRHWRRLLETPQGLQGAPLMANRMVYGVGMLAIASTAAGAIVLTSKALLDGKDPYDMTTEKFWVRAFLQGGGLGFLGDVLMRDSTADRSPQQGLFELLGPTAGTLAQLYELTKGNIDESAAGKDTHAGAEVVGFAKGMTPYVGLWYARAAINHMGLHALQENLSPGYLSRMQRRAQKDWGQDYWWKPGTGAPDRAPNMAAAVGE